jgi:L-ascorbate 6-phosphate lactonase
MPAPRLAHRALLEEITAPLETSGAFWWLGQHSFVVRLGEAVCYIDPYLADDPARQTPPLLHPGEVVGAHLVLCTHHHGDHLDPVALTGIAVASPGARFVVPRPHCAQLLNCGIGAERLLPLLPGERTVAGGVTVTAIKARHEFFEEGPEGFPYLGYVLEGNGLAVYHAGDTVVYEGLFSTLARWRLDAAFLPINGRDAERYRAGCIGNMTYQEAVDLAGDLQVALAVPAHWDMFAMNSEDPEKFARYLDAKFPGLPCWIGAPGTRVPLRARVEARRPGDEPPSPRQR